MNIDTLCELVEYHYWANARVWNCVMALTEEQFNQPLTYSIGSIHAQVVHTMSAEWMWLSRLKGMSPTAMFHVEDYPTREFIHTRWEELENDFRGYVSNQTDDILAEMMEYVTSDGTKYRAKRIQVLLQVLNHATDHRAQILAMIHSLGGETIAQDYMFYVRELHPAID